MTPFLAKLIAVGLSLVAIAMAVTIAKDSPTAQASLFVLVGVLTGKEFFAKTGDVSLLTNVDDIKRDKK